MFDDDWMHSHDIGGAGGLDLFDSTHDIGGMDPSDPMSPMSPLNPMNQDDSIFDWDNPLNPFSMDGSDAMGMSTNDAPNYDATQPWGMYPMDVRDPFYWQKLEHFESLHNGGEKAVGSAHGGGVETADATNEEEPGFLTLGLLGWLKRHW